MITINKTTDPRWPTLFRGRDVSAIKKLDSSGDSIDEVRFDGDPSLLLQSGTPRVLIIGTRDASPYGRETTGRIVEALAHSALQPVILSGLAMGIDGIAHARALEAGLPQVAVLPTGLDAIYPYVHRQLAESIKSAEHSCLATMFPDGTAPMALNFLVRNALMAAMADLVIVVETKRKGGAIVTARYAAEWDIPVLAVPGRIDDPRSAGCNELIESGIATMLTDPDHLEKTLHKFFIHD